MGRVSVTAIIEAPVEKVWELWTEIERYPEWFPGVRRVISHEGRTDRKGACYTLDLGVARAHGEITNVEPPTLHEHIFDQSPPPVAGSATIRFRSVDGGTEMTFDAWYEMRGGALGKLVDRLLLSRLAEPRMASEVPAFKRFVEQQAP